MRRLRSLWLGLLVVIALAGGIGLALTSTRLAGNPMHALLITFPSADGLVSGSDVLEAGAKIGYIGDIQPTAHNQALVTVRIDDDHWPLHAGLTASIRPKSLLGEKYVDLHDGPQSRSAYLGGAVLHAPASADPVELDQFINSLDPDTRTAVRVLLDDLGAGLAGRGGDLNTAIAAGRSDLENLAVTGHTIANRDPDLDRILVELDGLLSRISSSDQLNQISQLIDNGQNTLNAIEAVRTAFSRQFNDADVALADLNTAFGQAAPSLRSTLDLAPALLNNLRTEAGLLANLGTAVTSCPGGGTDCTLPLAALEHGLERGPTVSGGAVEYIDGAPAYPIFRICLSNIPGLSPALTGQVSQPSCDNSGSAQTGSTLPGSAGGAAESAGFAAFMGA
jgi:phospholipid/cholesterol/gamma-HCH transport system substrate-binding protein